MDNLDLIILVANIANGMAATKGSAIDNVEITDDYLHVALALGLAAGVEDDYYGN